MNSGSVSAATAKVADDLLIGKRLGEELAGLETFIDLLRREESALASGKADLLPPLVEQKSALAGRLGQLLIEREAALTRLGLESGRPGMEAWLGRQQSSAPATAAALKSSWERLLDLARSARQQQELNGKLIAIQLQATQQALTALMSASGRTLTYGPDGHQRLGGGGRPLGSA